MTSVLRRPPAFRYGLFLRQVNAEFRPVLGDEEIRAELAIMAPYFFVALPALLLQKSMLVAVTDGQLLVSRWSVRRHRAPRVCVVPANIGMITTRRRQWTTTIVLDGQGTGPIRLQAVKGHRAELEEVLAAAQAVGTLVAV